MKMHEEGIQKTGGKKKGRVFNSVQGDHLSTSKVGLLNVAVHLKECCVGIYHSYGTDTLVDDSVADGVARVGTAHDISQDRVHVIARHFVVLTERSEDLQQLDLERRVVTGVRACVRERKGG